MCTPLKRQLVKKVAVQPMTPIVSMYAYHQQDTSQVPRGVRFDFLDIAVTQHDIPGLTQMHRKTSARARDASAGSQTMIRLHQLVIMSGQLSSITAAKQAAAQNHPSPVPAQKHVKTNPKVLTS